MFEGYLYQIIGTIATLLVTVVLYMVVYRRTNERAVVLSSVLNPGERAVFYPRRADESNRNYAARIPIGRILGERVFVKRGTRRYPPSWGMRGELDENRTGVARHYSPTHVQIDCGVGQDRLIVPLEQIGRIESAPVALTGVLKKVRGGMTRTMKNSTSIIPPEALGYIGEYAFDMNGDKVERDFLESDQEESNIAQGRRRPRRRRSPCGIRLLSATADD
jgi:hypothetical protein